MSSRQRENVSRETEATHYVTGKVWRVTISEEPAPPPTFEDFEPTSCPFLDAWRRDPRYPVREALGLLPDAVTDTGRKRSRAAEPATRFLELLRAEHGPLVRVAVPLPDDLDVYGAELPDLTRAVWQTFLPHVPGLARIESDRERRNHAHLIAPRRFQSALEGVPELDPWEIREALPAPSAAYLRKPRDARACRPRVAEVARYGLPALEAQRLDAAEDYLAARALYGTVSRGLLRFMPRAAGRPRPSSLPTCFDVHAPLQAVSSSPRGVTP